MLVILRDYYHCERILFAVRLSLCKICRLLTNLTWPCCQCSGVPVHPWSVLRCPSDWLGWIIIYYQLEFTVTHQDNSLSPVQQQVVSSASAIIFYTSHFLHYYATILNSACIFRLNLNNHFSFPLYWSCPWTNCVKLSHMSESWWDGRGWEYVKANRHTFCQDQILFWYVAIIICVINKINLVLWYISSDIFQHRLLCEWKNQNCLFKLLLQGII